MREAQVSFCHVLLFKRFRYSNPGCDNTRNVLRNVSMERNGLLK